MDKITKTLKDYYAGTFARHGATAKGVDWNDESELLFRYDKMLAVLQMDFAQLPPRPTLLDVGCGWGGLFKRAREIDLPIRYTGIDVVGSMIEHGRREFADAEFVCGDVFALPPGAGYDFVVCNAILTQRLSVSAEDMTRFAEDLLRKMFDLCRYGIAFNVMSTCVNFMVDNLYYREPGETLTWLLKNISPRVRLDHGYSSLRSGRGKFYDFTAYVYKD